MHAESMCTENASDVYTDENRDCQRKATKQKSNGGSVSSQKPTCCTLHRRANGGVGKGLGLVEVYVHTCGFLSTAHSLASYLTLSLPCRACLALPGPD